MLLHSQNMYVLRLSHSSVRALSNSRIRVSSHSHIFAFHSWILTFLKSHNQSHIITGTHSRIISRLCGGVYRTASSALPERITGECVQWALRWMVSMNGVTRWLHLTVHVSAIFE